MASRLLKGDEPVSTGRDAIYAHVEKLNAMGKRQKWRTIEIDGKLTITTIDVGRVARPGKGDAA